LPTTQLKIEMDSEEYLQPIAVISFMIGSGGRVTNNDLVGNFINLLNVETEVGKKNYDFLKR